MSFSTGLSGLRAATSDLNVTGNNIANAGTTGFKQSRAEFGDVYAASLSESGSRAIGSGVTLQKVAQQFTQGTITFTQRPLDLAINGRGFFVLDDGGEQRYTRAGVFGIDKDGFVVSNTGGNLVGFGADSSGTIQTGNPTDLKIEKFDLLPNRTTNVELSFNLDAKAAAPDPTTNGSFDPDDQNSFDHATSLTVYDSEGIPHVATLYFRKDQPDPAIETGVNNDWFVYTEIDGALVNNNPANMTVPKSIVDPANTGAGTISTAITTPATYRANYADEYTVVRTAAGFDITSRNLVTGATATVSSAGFASPKAIAINGLTITITGATVVGDSFTVRPPIPPDQNQTAAAYKVQFNTDGTLNTSPPVGFVSNLVIDDWVPAIPIQTNFDSNAEPVGPNGGFATPVFNGVVDAGFSDFAIDIAGSTQFGDDFNINALRQDGYGHGQLVGTEIAEDGTLFARYTNGQSLTLGQVILADFQNQQALTPVGNTQWAQSFESGEPIQGIAKVGAFGALQSGALEDSNVDISEQLVNLIIAQRNFQANAKTIETNNAITQTVINLRT